MPSRLLRCILALSVALCAGPGALAQGSASASKRAQTPSVTGAIRGQVTDPTGAIIPGATVQLTSSGQTYTAQTGSDGGYSFRALPPGSYTLNVTMNGFTPYTRSGIVIASGSARTINAALAIAVQQQVVQVTAEGNTVDTSPENNVSAVVISGKNLDSLSDDPDELQNQLTALAGPSTGPNGAEIFIDGFTGGQLPPKSAIREIRVNQNPFSAEYDKLGYGRVEIFTKPGTEKLHGQAQISGNQSSFNAQNPFLQQQPSYYSYRLQGSISDALTERASGFFSTFIRNRQDQNIVVANVPYSCADPNAPNPVINSPGVPCNSAYGNPNTRMDFSPRFDFGLGKNNTLTVVYHYNRFMDTNDGFGELTLPTQAYNLHNVENTLQISDSQVLSSKLVNETRFQYRRNRDSQIAVNGAPSAFVQGAFQGGGNNSGVVRDSQDHYELQNNTTLTLGDHGIRFGVRLRALRDANSSTAGANGSFTYASLASYNSGTPQQYEVNYVANPVARATLFDAALFYQDDWKVSPKLTFSYGLRYEAQNYLHDYTDLGPRLEVAYALGHGRGKRPPKTVLRAGYGWFYNRFDVASPFSASSATPYVIQTIHQNGLNQQDFVVKNPAFNALNTPAISTIKALAGGNPTIWNLSPNLRAALDMEAAVGVDRQIAKNITGNITFLDSRGVHQYLSDNINAPLPGEYDPTTGQVFARPIPNYNGNIYQFQSGGIYKQQEVIASVHATYKRASFFSFYAYNNAHADTSGATYFPSQQTNPGFDYGRATFDVANRFVLFGNFMLPYGVSVSPIFAANSGNPFDVVVGNDLNGDNQFNDRPSFADCGSPQAYTGPTGANPAQYRVNGRCFNVNPAVNPLDPKSVIPFDYGTGPSNYSLNMRLSKVIGIGPRVERGAGGADRGDGGPRGGPGLGARGLSGGGAGPGRLEAETHRKYSLTLVAYSANVFNHQNLAAPNGVLFSHLFNTSQGLAGGFFSPHYPGNRSIDLQASFNF